MTAHGDGGGSICGYVAGVDFVRRPGRDAGFASEPAMVLLHGIGSNAHSWVPMMQALDPAIDAIAWNAPGYGRSEALGPPAPTPRDYAAALLRWLDALAVRKTVVVGHSLGALFAGAFAAAFPERVVALVLVSPALGYGVPPGAPLPAHVQARIDDLERLGPAAFAAGRAGRLLHDPEAKPQVVAAVTRAMAAVRSEGYVQAVQALGAGDLVADARAIAAPALVVVGARDVITPPANARTVAAALRHGAFEQVDDVGHALPQEAPAALARLLAAFVRERADVR